MFKVYLCIAFSDFLCSGRTHARRYQQHTPPRYRHQHGVYCPGETNTPQLLRQRSKKRSSSLQREELLQIIQANMEKNNLSFQMSRYVSLKKYLSQILVYESDFYKCGDFVTCKGQTMFFFCKIPKWF